MAGILGFGANAYRPIVMTSIQIQTSAEGLAVPVIYGTTRTGPNLLWYNGFLATQVSSGGKGGALGGSAGKNGPAQYQYSTNVILGVCEGPIEGFGQVWASKTPTSMSELGLAAFTGTYPQAVWGFLTSNYPSEARPYTGLAYLAGANYQLGASAELPSHNFEVYGVFSARVVYTVTTIPAGPPYTITVGQRLWADGSVQSMWVSNNSVPGFTLVPGPPAAGQYSVSAGVYTFNAADAASAVTIIWNGKGQDADPALVVPDILSNPYYGISFPSSMIGEVVAYTENKAIPGSPYQVTVDHAGGFIENLSVYHIATDTYFTCVAASPGPQQFTVSSVGVYTFNSADSGKTVEISYSAQTGLTSFQDYCWAAGFFISPAYIQQAQVSGALDEIAKYTNSEIVWSSGALKLVPRGDKVLAANGHIYTPPLAPVVYLDDDQYQAGKGGGGASGAAAADPVVITRKRVSDQRNVVQVEVKSRENQYNAAMVEATDQAAVDQYGRRPTGSMKADLFTDPVIGRLSAQLLLQREAIKNQYGFTLDGRYIFLDPMDIVSLTDEYLGLDETTWERIMSIEEQDDGTLMFVAEDYASGVSNAEEYAFSEGIGFAANYNVPPGDVNDPTIVEPSVQIATNTGLEVWGAFSGADPNWGGCDVYLSSDDVTYNYIGRKWGAARMGVLTAPLPAAASPDTTNTLSVDLSESFAQLVSGTVDDANLGNTLVLVDDEMISFTDVTLTAPYNYDLDTYLIRGQFGTTSALHLAGARFTRLDEMIFAIPYDMDQIGQTVYIKACSFNLYGGGLQDLSAVTAYPHLIVGPPLPAQVQGFQVQQQGGPVVFSWTDLNEFQLKGYDILYGPTTGTIEGAIFLTLASRATEMTNAAVPPGTWRFYIRGRNIADQVGPESYVDFTVRNTNFIIEEQQSESDWFGTLTNFVKHPSGVLVPTGPNLCNTYGWQVFDQYSPDPYATSTFEALEIDSGGDGDMRAFITAIANDAPGETDPPLLTPQLRWKTSTGSYDPYVDWNSGTITARYVQGRVIMDNSVPAYLSTFDVTLDGPPITQTFSATISASGTAVTWPSPFRNPPVVIVSPASTAATGGSASAITILGATINLYNGSTPVSGPANIAATGV